MARDLFQTDYIKLEVVGDELSLQPDPFGLVEAGSDAMGGSHRNGPRTTEPVCVARTA